MEPVVASDAQVMGKVALAHRFPVRQGREALAGVRPHGLEHPQPRRPVPPSAAHEQALGHEPIERVDAGVGDRLGRVDRRAPDEHGHTGKAGLFVVVEQAVAPVEGRLQRLLAARRIPWPAAQRAECHFQASGDLARGQQGAARRRELDRQR